MTHGEAAGKRPQAPPVHSRTVTKRLTFGPARSAAELEAQASNEALAFNTPYDSCVAWLHTNRNHVRLVRSGGHVVGGLVQYEMGQFLGGRSVRNTGIAGVAVDPTARGQGAARALMRATLNELHREGVAVSTLYPTTFILYERAGYAAAGHRYRFRLPLARLGRVPADAPLRRLNPERDAKVVERLYRRIAKDRPGWLDRNHFIWERVYQDPGGAAVHGYVVPGGDGGVDGYVVYTQDAVGHYPGAAGRYPYGIKVRDVQVRDGAAARRILAFFSACRTLARDVTWHGALDDHLLLQVPEIGTEISVAETWMLRIVHVQAALGQRGYPPRTSARLDFEVTDDVVAGNRGRWVLEVDRRAGKVSRTTRKAGRNTLRLDIRALASLYTGHLSARRLADLDLIEGSSTSLNLAERLFAGPPPSMPDYF